MKLSCISKVFLHFQNRNTSVEIDYGHFKPDLSGKHFIYRQCLVSQDSSNVSYSNGLKIPTQMVLEVNALRK